MKRKLKWLAIVLAVSLLGFGTALLLWPRDRIQDAWENEIKTLVESSLVIRNYSNFDKWRGLQGD